MIVSELTCYAQTLPSDLAFVVIVPISDLHYGSPQCSVPHINQTIKLLETPWIYGICNGDLGESDIRTSKGDIFRQVGTPQDQRDWLKKKFMPVKEKILGMTDGNHEGRVYDQVGFDLTKDIAEALGCPYHPNGMMLKVSFGSNYEGHPDRPYSYKIYFHHGYGGARTDGAKIMKIRRLAGDIHADVYIQSHDHTIQAEPVSYLMSDERSYPEKINGELTGFETCKIQEHRKVLVKSGSTQKWGGYAQSHGMAPSQLGFPSIVLHGFGKRWVSVGF